VINPAVISTSRVRWAAARRIIRSVFPTIDLFEDIADPEDWPLLISAGEKTNPRLMETRGAIDRRRALRVAGSDGLVYPSVRDAGGQCAGLFCATASAMVQRSVAAGITLTSALFGMARPRCQSDAASTRHRPRLREGSSEGDGGVSRRVSHRPRGLRNFRRAR
jgi:hypothetical protein